MAAGSCFAKTHRLRGVIRFDVLVCFRPIFLPCHGAARACVEGPERQRPLVFSIRSQSGGCVIETMDCELAAGQRTAFVAVENGEALCEPSQDAGKALGFALVKLRNP